MALHVVTKPFPDTSRIYVSGNRTTLGDWEPGLVPLEKSADGSWHREFLFPRGTELEFKFSKGAWVKRELDPRGVQYQHVHTLEVERDTLL